MTFRSRCRQLLIADLFAITLPIVAATAFGADVISTWDGTTNNWTSNHWSSPLFPNNGNGGFTYDAIVNAGVVTLNQNIAIEKLSFAGGTITGNNNLDVHSMLNWTGGLFSGTGTTTIGGGTISGSNNKLLESRTLSIDGDVNWSGGEILRPSMSDPRGKIIVESGVTFTASGPQASNRNLDVNLQVESGGRFLSTGARATFVAHFAFAGPGGIAINNGIIEAGANSQISLPGGSGNGSFIVRNNAQMFILMLDADEFNYSGDIILDNGIFDILVFDGSDVEFLLPSTLSGTGQFTVDTLLNAKKIAPGNPLGENVGSLFVQGNYEQTAEGVLAIDVEGASPNEFDKLSISGNAILGGTLMFDASALSSTDTGTTIEILTAGNLTGAFDSVETVGSETIYIRPIYDYGSDGGGGSASGELCDLGDMNCDGQFNGDDTTAFAVALRDLDAYFENYFTFTTSGGDLDGIADGDFHPNGRIDFDDIDDFVSLTSSAGSGITLESVLDAIRDQANVPEPATGSLCLVMLGGICLRCCRFKRQTP